MPPSSRMCHAPCPQCWQITAWHGPGPSEGRARCANWSKAWHLEHLWVALPWVSETAPSQGPLGAPVCAWSHPWVLGRRRLGWRLRLTVSPSVTQQPLPLSSPLLLCCFPPCYLQTGIFQAWARCPCTRSPWSARTGCPPPSTSCGNTARWGARSRPRCPRTPRPCSTWSSSSSTSSSWRNTSSSSSSSCT